MDKEAVVHIYNGILLNNKKNIFESVLMRWMNLEPAIWRKYTEVSQEEKKYISFINTYIWNLEGWY